MEDQLLPRLMFLSIYRLLQGRKLPPIYTPILERRPLLRDFFYSSGPTCSSALTAHYDPQARERYLKRFSLRFRAGDEFSSKESLC